MEHSGLAARKLFHSRNNASAHRKFEDSWTLLVRCPKAGTEVRRARFFTVSDVATSPSAQPKAAEPLEKEHENV
jgi:hypothetical protein